MREGAVYVPCNAETPIRFVIFRCHHPPGRLSNADLSVEGGGYILKCNAAATQRTQIKRKVKKNKGKWGSRCGRKDESISQRSQKIGSWDYQSLTSCCIFLMAALCRSSILPLLMPLSSTLALIPWANCCSCFVVLALRFSRNISARRASIS